MECPFAPALQGNDAADESVLLPVLRVLVST